MASKKKRSSRRSRHGNSGSLSDFARVVAWREKSLTERNRYNDQKNRAYHQGEADAYEKVIKLLGG
jgi:hypothetical protein